jgi:hypothetical protein
MFNIYNEDDVLVLIVDTLAEADDFIRRFPNETFTMRVGE